MKKTYTVVLIIALLFTLIVPEGIIAYAETNDLIASENVTLQSVANAYTASANLRVKNQQNATERVSFLKFNYDGISLGTIGEITLNLYVKSVSGTGQEELNKLRLYWSADTSWSAANNAVKYVTVSAYNNKTEIGDNIIQIPKVTSTNQQYYSYDVTKAVLENAAAGNNSITFVLKQDQMTNSNGGIDFASIGQTGYEPYLSFKEGALKPEAHIKNGTVIIADADTALQSGAGINCGADAKVKISSIEQSEGLLRFDLSGFAREDIAGAGLRLYISEADTYHDTLLQTAGVASEWEESSVTEQSELGVGSIYCDYKVSACKGTDYWIDIDVSELIENADDLSNFSLLVSQFGNNSGGISFLTKENEKGAMYAPHLVVRERFATDAEVTGSLAASDDVYVRYDDASGVDYSAQNFNGSDLMVKMNSNADRKAFIKFDLSDANIDLSDITANLSVYYMGKSGTGADASTRIDVYYCPDSNWDEDTLTGDTALGMVESAYRPENYVGTIELGHIDMDKGFHSIDVADFIAEHIDDNYTRTITFMLMQTGFAGANGGATFTAKETAADRAAKIDIYPNITRGYAAKPVMADTYVRFGSYADKNFGTAEALDIKNYDDDESSVRELYIKADISEQPENTSETAALLLPLKSTNLAVSHAKLYAATLEEDYYDGSWPETIVTANSIGDYLDTDNMTFITDFEIPRSQTGKYICVDVSDYINNAIETGCTEVTFKIVENDESSINNLVQFYSRESMFSPMLGYCLEDVPVCVVNLTETDTGDGLSVSAKLETAAAAERQGWYVNGKRDVQIILAGYDADARLTQVKCKSMVLSDMRTVYEEELDNAEACRLFVWKDTDSMKPYRTLEITDENDMPISEDYYNDADIGGYEAELSAALAEDTTDYLRGRDKIVVAALMGNQRTPFVSGEWRHWNNSDTSAGEYSYSHQPYSIDEDTGLRDIAASDYPSIGLFDVSDADYVDYQMQLLKMAGVDAVSVNIHNSYSDDAWKIDNIKNNIVPALKKYGIKGFVRLDSYSTDNFTNAQLSELIDMFGDTILKIDSRPVISVFGTGSSASRENLTKTWKQEYADAGATEPFIMYWYDKSLYDSFDGAYRWAGVNNSGYSVTDEYDMYYDAEQAKQSYVSDAFLARKVNARTAADESPLDYCAEGVSPAFNNLPVMGWGGTKSIIKSESGENGEVYKFRWANAANNQLPMIMIPTWDDWSEGTQIMPSLENGNTYLLITRHYAAAYKNEQEDLSADFNIADWIYKIRKTTNDAVVLVDMEQASEYIAAGNYSGAKALVQPYAIELGIPNVTSRFGY